MDTGLRWVAALALALLLLGLLALAVADPYEGPLVVMLDPEHAVRALDVFGGLVILSATALTWGVGLAWQRRNAVGAAYHAPAESARQQWSIGRRR